MAKVTINCYCGKLFVKEVVGDKNIVCKNCGRVYQRRYIGKGRYEIVLIKEV